MEHLILTLYYHKKTNKKKQTKRVLFLLAGWSNIFHFFHTRRANCMLPAQNTNTRSNSKTKTEFPGRSDMCIKCIKSVYKCIKGKNNQAIDGSFRFFSFLSSMVAWFNDQSFLFRLHFKCQIFYVGHLITVKAASRKKACLFYEVEAEKS